MILIRFVPVQSNLQSSFRELNNQFSDLLSRLFTLQNICDLAD